MATPLAVAGEAMETLKMKIFMLKKENTEVTEKMQEAEKVVNKNSVMIDLPIFTARVNFQEKTESNERVKKAEDKIKELSKQIHSRKLLLDDHTDRLQKNLHMIRRKEEATVAAREEIKAQSLREMQLQSEVNS